MRGGGGRRARDRGSTRRVLRCGAGVALPGESSCQCLPLRVRRTTEMKSRRRAPSLRGETGTDRAVMGGRRQTLTTKAGSPKSTKAPPRPLRRGQHNPLRRLLRSRRSLLSVGPPLRARPPRGDPAHRRSPAASHKIAPRRAGHQTARGWATKGRLQPHRKASAPTACPVCNLQGSAIARRVRSQPPCTSTSALLPPPMRERVLRPSATASLPPHR